MSGAMGINQDEEILNKSQLSLANIKKDIETSYEYFTENAKRYREFMIIVFKSALTNADKDNLNLVGKPSIEFPILEAYISRERGELAKAEPQMEVVAAEGLTVGKIDDSQIQLMKVIQAHLSEIFCEADANGFSDELIDDTMGGGFGGIKVSTEYVNETSFMQRICVERIVDPTLCGFDPLATKKHKGDGRYCFELYPMTQEEFALEFGIDKAKTFSFTRAVGNFNWTYKNQDIKIVLVADYYVKVEKINTIVRVAENDLDIPTTMTLKEYNEMVRTWERIEQIPVILERRKSTITRIDRYRVCQNEMLDHVETSYPMLPLIFVDGDSKRIQNTNGAQIEQMTRPYVWHAKGAQRLMNFAGQTVGQELENMPRNTYMTPVAAIPKAYIKAWQKPQIAGTLAYNHVDPEHPDVPIPPPTVVQRIATPPIVQETFSGMQNIVQQIIGSYDAAMGIQGDDISGKAIREGAMQSNVVATRYILNYIRGLQRAAELIIHLIPLFYTTPRSIPVRLPNGKRDYQVINAQYPKVDKQKKMLQQAQEMGMGGMQNEIEPDGDEEAEGEEMEDAIMFNYDPKSLGVRVKPGVNARIQKHVSFELLTKAMAVSPTLAEFFNRQGLPVILETLDLPGIEGLKEMVGQFQAQMEQERQTQAGQPTDTDKIVQAEVMKSQLEAQARDQKTQADMAINVTKAAIAREEVELKRQELELKAHEAHMRLHLDRENEAAAQTSATIELAVDVMKHQAEMDMQEKAQSQGQGSGNQQ